MPPSRRANRGRRKSVWFRARGGRFTLPKRRNRMTRRRRLHLMPRARLPRRGRNRVRGRVDEQRIAIGLRLGDSAGAHRLTRPWSVLHHDSLPELSGELPEHGAGNDVDDASRRDGHDCLHRLRRPGFRKGLRGCNPQSEGGQQYHGSVFHVVLVVAIRRVGCGACNHVGIVGRTKHQVQYI